MGLDINSILFLLAARKSGVNFGDVLMIGRQELNVYPAKMRRLLVQAGFSGDLFDYEAPDTGYAEPVFKTLGARTVSSLDASAFEGAEFIYDLNQPVSDDLKQKFDLVFDGGTLEHAFNFPRALQNCMEMVRKDGCFIIHTCANNWCGHGFYQFNPELFYNVLCDDNGFEVERMIFHVVGPYGRWYKVANSGAISSRVELMNSFPLPMLVQSRREKILPLFTKTPQQSDYTVRWDKQSLEKNDPRRPAWARMLPEASRLANVMKTGWHFFHNFSLRNRRLFRPVAGPVTVKQIGRVICRLFGSLAVKHFPPMTNLAFP
jgi:SAM-dependent methyltransferase